MSQTPTVGRIVHYFPGPHDAPACVNGNGADDPVAAVVVRAWGDDCVNLRLLLDFTSNDGCPIRTSVQRRGAAPEGTFSWDWPERV